MNLQSGVFRVAFGMVSSDPQSARCSDMTTLKSIIAKVFQVAASAHQTECAKVHGNMTHMKAV